jgi:hypothetical protein
MAVAVMLNNYLHDLATAVFAVSALAAWFLLKSSGTKEATAVLRPVVDGLSKVGFFSLGWILLGGVIRAICYRQYEWMEAAGKSQIPALMVKHVILVTLVIAGLVVLFRVRSLARTGTDKESRG